MPFEVKVIKVGQKLRGWFEGDAFASDVAGVRQFVPMHVLVGFYLQAKCAKVWQIDGITLLELLNNSPDYMVESGREFASMKCTAATMGG